MIQPIVNNHLCFGSTVMRSLIRRYNAKELSSIVSKSFHKESLKKEDQNVGLIGLGRDDPTSIVSSWRRLFFPTSNRLYKFDNVDPNEWSLIYRIRWSSKTVYGITYLHVFALFGSVYVIFNSISGRKTYHHESITDDDYMKLILFISCGLIVAFSSLVIFSSPKVVLRGYYSTKYQRYMFIRPRLRAPWQVRKMIVAPGLLESIKSKSWGFLQPTFKVQGTKLFIFEQEFFFPAFYNVACGYSPPDKLTITRFNPDDIFGRKLRKR